MRFPMVCPKCDSTEIQATLDGNYKCLTCGFEFFSYFVESEPSILLELRKHTALLRKLVSRRYR